MERPHTIAGLIDKRRKILGEIEWLQAKLKELIIDLDHMDHAIHLFCPDLDLSLVKPKRFPARYAAPREEMQRFVLDLLRAASEPLTSQDIALEIVKDRGLASNDLKAVGKIRRRVGTCLYRLLKKGRVKDVPTTGTYKGWEIN